MWWKYRFIDVKFFKNFVQFIITNTSNLYSYNSLAKSLNSNENTIKSADYIIDIGLFAGKNGGKILYQGNSSEFKNIRSNGVRAIVFDDDDELVTAKIAYPDDKELLIVTKKGRLLDLKKRKQESRVEIQEG